MARVGTVYTVDRYGRTPEEVVAALLRELPAADAEPSAGACDEQHASPLRLQAPTSYES